jgi:hypothetical protein
MFFKCTYTQVNYFCFGPQHFMVSTFKKPVGAPMHPDNEAFDTKLSKPTVE